MKAVSDMTKEEKREQMLNAPVDRLIMSLAGPAVLSMLVTSLYNMADTFFVSQLGTSASGAVGVIFSLMAIFQAFAFMIGQGAGNNMSRAIGAGDTELAEVYNSVGFFTELIVGVFFCIAGNAVIEDLVYWLGATETIAPFAKDYCRYVLFGTPFIMASFGMNNLLRFQGYSSYAAVGIVTGGILNIILDPVFIFAMGMGTAGAAVATSVSQFISFVILFCMCMFRKGCIRISYKKFRPTVRMYLTIVSTGLPSLARQGIMSVSGIVFNHLAHPYGDACIAAFSIVQKYAGLINSAALGIGQGFQPVCGQNYGAKKYGRVNEAYRFLVKMQFIVLIVLAAVSFIFAGPIVTVFRRDDPEVIRIGTTLLKFQSFTLPLMAVIISSNMLSQTTGYGLKATFVSCLRSGICLIPLQFILPKFLGLTGLQLSQPISDVLSSAIAILVISGILRELKEKEKEAGI